MGYVAMHEVNAAMCLAGGILGPRFEASAARDHHSASGLLQIEPNEPTSEALAGAKGDLSYGEVVVFEVNLPGGGELAIPALPLLQATRLVFKSEEARDLFRARMSGFGDIPDDLLPMAVQASLFATREQSNQTPLAVPEAAATASTSPGSDSFASAAVVRRFREIDRCAGGLLAAVSTLQGSPATFRLIGRLGAISLSEPDGSPVEQFASELALMVDPSSEAANYVPVFASIAEVLNSGAMDDGFSATALLREAEAAWARQVPADSSKSSAVEKFWTFTNWILAGFGFPTATRRVPAGLVIPIARVVGGSADTKLLLMAGVVVGAFANAAILVALADAPPERLRGALCWMMGSAADATWPAVARCAGALLLLGGVLVWRARDLDVLSLGDEPAAALGVDVDRVSRQLFLVASWLAAATVAAAGLIGFVGLVVPNIARALGARQHRPMLLLSALYGAVLLVAADLLARTLRAPADLPLGAVTALVGVPFFLLRLRRLAA
jgi:ABC-type Mn2+/Zn2+ transport system permease subunit